MGGELDKDKKRYQSLTSSVLLRRSGRIKQSMRLSSVYRPIQKELKMMELIQDKNPNKTDGNFINNCLGKHYLMQSLKYNEKNDIIANMSLYKAKPNTTLYIQGSPGNFWYIVLNGQLDFCVDGIQKKTFTSGDSFGEFALIYNCPQDGTVKTVTECELWILDKEYFQKIKECLFKNNYKEITDFLKIIKLPICDEIKLKMVNYSFKNSYKANDIICNEGDPSTCIYLIKQGEVNFLKNGQLVKTAKRAEFFGENGLIEGNKKSYEVVAKTNCIIYTISNEFFQNQFGEDLNEQLYFTLLKIALSKSSSFKSINTNILNNAFRSFNIKSFRKNSVIYRKQMDISKKICVVLDGNIIDKGTDTVIAEPYNILFEDNVVNENEYIIQNDLISESNCIIAEANYGDIKNIFGEGNIKIAKGNSHEATLIEKIKLFRNLPGINSLGINNNIGRSERSGRSGRSHISNDRGISHERNVLGNLHLFKNLPGLNSLGKNITGGHSIGKERGISHEKNVLGNTHFIKNTPGLNSISKNTTGGSSINNDKGMSRENNALKLFRNLPGVKDLKSNICGGNNKNSNEMSHEMKAIEKINLFRNLNKEKKEFIEKNLKIEKFNNGDKILIQGNIGNKLYIIKKGKVDFFLDSKYMKSETEGDDFGSKSLIVNDRKNLSTIVANGPVECYTLTADVFKKILNPELKQYFLNQYYLNDYSIQLKDCLNLKTLGNGSYGLVNLVRNKKNKQLYAVKAMDLIQIKEENILRRVELEKNLLLNMEHPFIAKTVKYIKGEVYLYYIMEYCKGKELFDVMRDINLFNKAQTQFYSASILEVINYLHHQKIIYRDLKPENIMVLENGYIKFFDFGTVKEIKSNRTKTFIGTISYMAPEVFTGKGYSFQVDIWSLGVMMYEFICGKLPFGDEDMEDPMEFYNVMIKQDLTFPPFVTDDIFKDLISKLLIKDSNKRLCQYTQIRNHEYFKDFDWEKLLSLNLPAPYKFKLSTAIENQANPEPYLTYLKRLGKKPYNNLKASIRQKNFKKWLKNF